MSNYLNSSKYYPVRAGMDGNPDSRFSYILEHPKQCKPPIDRQLTYEEMRAAMGMRN